MKFLKLSVICLIISSVIGCNSGLAPFPADFIYVANPDSLTCSKHEIINKDPVTVGDGIDVPWNECPHVFGFKSDDVGPVMDWIRTSQEIAKKRCK